MADGDSTVKIDVGYNLAQNKVNLSLELTNIFFVRNRNPLADAWRRRRIERRAKKDARGNIPPTDAPENATDIERDILARRTKLFQQAKDAILDWKTRVQEQLLRLRPKAINADAIVRIVEGQIDKYRTSFSELYDNDREYARSADRVERFKEKHGLDRDGEIPEFRVQVAAILVVTILIETAFNGALLKDISRQGFIGGWTLAVLLSLVNVAAGLFMGFLYRYWQYNAPLAIPQKVVRTLTITAAAAIIIFNTLVAHYRALAELAVTQARVTNEGTAVVPIADLLEHVFGNLFDFGGSWGTALFALGIGVASFAAYEGYRGLTDPYPGYGKLWRQYRDARNLRRDYVNKYKKSAHALIDQVIKDGELVAFFFKQLEGAIEAAIVQFDTLHQKAENWLLVLNDVTVSHLSAYRNANLRERSVLLKRQERRRRAGKKPDLEITPAPHYFSEAARVPNLDFENHKQTTEEWGGTLLQVRRNLAELEALPKKLEDLRSRIDENIRAALDEMEKLDRDALKRAHANGGRFVYAYASRPRWWYHLLPTAQSNKVEG